MGLLGRAKITLKGCYRACPAQLGPEKVRSIRAALARLSDRPGHAETSSACLNPRPLARKSVERQTGIMPAFLNMAMARGMCMADVTSTNRSSPSIARSSALHRWCPRIVIREPWSRGAPRLTPAAASVSALAGCHALLLLTGPTAIPVAVVAAGCSRPNGPEMARPAFGRARGVVFAFPAPQHHYQRGVGEPSGMVGNRLKSPGPAAGDTRFPADEPRPGPQGRGKQRQERETRGEQGPGCPLPLGEEQQDQAQDHDGKQQGTRLDGRGQQLLRNEHDPFLYLDSAGGVAHSLCLPCPCLLHFEPSWPSLNRFRQLTSSPVLPGPRCRAFVAWALRHGRILWLVAVALARAVGPGHRQALLQPA